MNHLNKWLRYRRNLLLESERSVDDDIYEFKIKVRISKSTGGEELGLLGIESLKNDIRAISDVTVVRTEESDSSADSLIIIMLIKVNIRLIPHSETPERYIKKHVLPDLVGLFNKQGNYPALSKPRIVAISRSVDHFS